MKGRTALLLLAALGSAVGCASPTAPALPAQIDAQIRAARTAADHEAIAALFDRQAREAAAQAQEHDAVARSYLSLSLGTNDGIWMRHCASLAEKMRAAAGESTSLAAEHRGKAAALRN